MPRWLQRRLSFANVVAVSALVVAVAGGGYAIGGTSAPSTVQACVARGGVLHVRQGPRCPRGQRALAWNRLGRRGLQGSNGTAGANGANGANGTNGAAGTNGVDGKTGLPGPTASAFASFSPPSAIAFTPAGVEVPVMSLIDGTPGRQLTTTFTANLLVNASILVIPNTAASQLVFCTLQISRAGGAFSAISRSAQTLATGQTQIPLTGAVTEPPGTFNFRIICGRNGPDPGASFYRGDMTVVATAA